MLEERNDTMSEISEASHMEPNILIEAVLVQGWTLQCHGLLQIVVQVLVRVEFMTVGGQENELDSILVRFQPFFDRFTVVDPEVIDDEDDFAFSIFDQLAEKLDKDTTSLLILI